MKLSLPIRALLSVFKKDIEKNTESKNTTQHKRALDAIQWLLDEATSDETISMLFHELDADYERDWLTTEEQCIYAVFLDLGIGVPADPEQALELYQKLAAEDCIYGKVVIACNHDDKNKKIKLLQPLADKGHPVAQDELADEIFNSTESADRKKAFDLAYAASQQGYLPAFTLMGFFYEEGIGVEKSSEKAKACYEITAPEGDVEAAFGLGMCFKQEDISQAIFWLEKAANQLEQIEYGPSACLELGAIFFNQEDFENATKWLTVAAQYSELGKCWLARCYLRDDENRKAGVRMLEEIVEATRNKDAIFFLAEHYATYAHTTASEQKKAYKFFQKFAEENPLKDQIFEYEDVLEESWNAPLFEALARYYYDVHFDSEKAFRFSQIFEKTSRYVSKWNLITHAELCSINAVSTLCETILPDAKAARLVAEYAFDSFALMTEKRQALLQASDQLLEATLGLQHMQIKIKNSMRLFLGKSKESPSFEIEVTFLLPPDGPSETIDDFEDLFEESDDVYFSCFRRGQYVRSYEVIHGNPDTLKMITDWVRAQEREDSSERPQITQPIHELPPHFIEQITPDDSRHHVQFTLIYHGDLCDGENTLELLFDTFADPKIIAQFKHHLDVNQIKMREPDERDSSTKDIRTNISVCITNLGEIEEISGFFKSLHQPSLENISEKKLIVTPAGMPSISTDSTLGAGDAKRAMPAKHQAKERPVDNNLNLDQTIKQLSQQLGKLLPDQKISFSKESEKIFLIYQLNETISRLFEQLDGVGSPQESTQNLLFGRSYQKITTEVVDPQLLQCSLDRLLALQELRARLKLGFNT